MNMQIDNYEQAIALTEKLKAALPCRVRPGKQLLQAIKDKTISATTWLEVDSVMYSGDMGGIMVNLQPGNDPKGEVYSTSLTHVVVDPEHELAAEIQAYQKQRIRRLKLQDRGGFAAELASRKKSRKRKSGKGFG